MLFCRIHREKKHSEAAPFFCRNDAARRSCIDIDPLVLRDTPPKKYSCQLSQNTCEVSGFLPQLDTGKYIGDLDSRFEPSGLGLSAMSDFAGDQRRCCFDVNHYAGIDVVRQSDAHPGDCKIQ